jgi:AcrR family transcriptional regulator
MISTRERILDAAELLFARRGFGSASLRDITAAAGANLAAANYHFRDKESLYTEVLLRRLRPVNRQRLERLDELVCRSKRTAPPLAEILRAFIAPAVELALSSPIQPAPFLGLMGRMLSDPLPFLDSVIRSEFQPIVVRFSAVLQKALPGISRTNLAWRMQFVAGAMLHGLGNGGRIRALHPEIGDASEPFIEQLIRFAEAGLRAPSAKPTEPTEGGKRCTGSR